MNPLKLDSMDGKTMDEDCSEQTLLSELPFQADSFTDDKDKSSTSHSDTTSFSPDLCPVIPSLEDLDEEFAKSRPEEKGWIPKSAFNLSNLLEVICKAMEQCQWSTIRFMAYGSKNKVYLATFPSGKEVMARLPFTCVISQNQLKSEVGAMLYAKAKMPPEWARLIPTVFAWSFDPLNEVGLPYIVMEKKDGSPLADLSGAMSFEQKLSVTFQVAQFTSALQAIGSEFDKIGGIYFENEQFTIGPLVRRKNQLGSHSMFSGPWDTTTEFFIAQLRDTLCHWQTELYPMVDELGNWRGNLYDGLRFLADLAVLIRKLDPEMDSPESVMHTGLHERNIIIDVTGQLSGIIDWEFAGITSETCATRVPRCLQSPEILNIKSTLEPCIEDVKQRHITTTKLRHHYMMERSRLDPGYMARLGKSADIQRLEDCLLEMWHEGWGRRNRWTEWVEAKKKEQYQEPTR